MYLSKTNKYKKIIILAVIIAVSLVAGFDFYRDGFPLTHDGQDHIARIANFYQNIREGILIPRWAGNLNWGYGHPILMFLYPLPSYIASLFLFSGFTLINSVKLVFITAYILSGLTMYVFVKELYGEDEGLLASLLYLLAPYRLVDLYVRGAIGEHVAFIFPPLLLYFLLKMSKKITKLNFSGASLSLAALVLSHNAVSIMFLPIVIIYMLFLIWKHKLSKLLLINFITVLILGFGLSAFFWIPALVEGKYTLRDIVTNADYNTRYVAIRDFFIPSWSFGGTNLLSKQIGVIHWLILSAALPIGYLQRKKDKRKSIFLIGSIIIFLASLMMMTPYSNFLWEKITLLQKFQFPWRFLSLSVFITAIIGGSLLSYLPKNKKLYVLVILTFALIIVNQKYWHAHGYLSLPETFYTGIYDGTTDTGESSPLWSVRFMEKRPTADAQVLEGQALIIQKERKTTKHVYLIHAQTKARIRENTLYFPGWNIFIDGNMAPIEFQDPDNRGLITFFINQGRHIVTVQFTDTKLRVLANLISVFSTVFLGGIIMSKYIKFMIRKTLS